MKSRLMPRMVAFLSGAGLPGWTGLGMYPVPSKQPIKPISGYNRLSQKGRRIRARRQGVRL